MRNPLCLIRTIWRTILHGGFVGGQFAWVSGHKLIEIRHSDRPRCMQILECETCGFQDIGWSRCANCKD